MPALGFKSPIGEIRKWVKKRRCIMNTTMDNATAYYFGLEVKVLYTMEICSLIRFASREFIVDIADLEFVHTLEQAA
jgi:hypothetical protein